MIRIDEEGNFRFGLLLNESDTKMLLELASLVGEDPHALMTNAIQTMWTAFQQRQVTSNG